MSKNKYPWIPKEYYAAVMYACKLIRKYKTFNVAVNTAAKHYGVSATEVAKHVRARQGAGQKGQHFQWFLVKYTLRLNGELQTQYEIVKATSSENARRRVPSGALVVKVFENRNVAEEYCGDRGIVVCRN